MIDTEALRERLAEQSRMITRYDDLKQCVALLETRNDVVLDIGEIDVTAGGSRPEAATKMGNTLLAFVEHEWENGNLQYQFMSWMGDQMEILERALK